MTNPKIEATQFKIRLQLPDGTFVENAENVVVLVEDNHRVGTYSRRVISLVKEAAELSLMQTGRF